LNRRTASVLGLGEPGDAHGGQVHEPADPGVGGGLDHPAGADHVDRPRHGGVDVVGHHRSGVDRHVAAVQQPLPGCRIGDITRHDATVQCGNRVQAHHVGAQAPATVGQRPAHEAVGAGDEHLAPVEGGEFGHHSVRLYWNCS
jgi:hypothetical protein